MFLWDRLGRSKRWTCGDGRMSLQIMQRMVCRACYGCGTVVTYNFKVTQGEIISAAKQKLRATTTNGAPNVAGMCLLTKAPHTEKSMFTLHLEGFWLSTRVSCKLVKQHPTDQRWLAQICRFSKSLRWLWWDDGKITAEAVISDKNHPRARQTWPNDITESPISLIVLATSTWCPA